MPGQSSTEQQGTDDEAGYCRGDVAGEGRHSEHLSQGRGQQGTVHMYQDLIAQMASLCLKLPSCEYTFENVYEQSREQ